MNSLFPKVLLVVSCCIFTNGVIAESDNAMARVTAWENGQQSQSFEVSAKGVYSAKCVESTGSRKVVITVEKNKDQAYSCGDSKVVIRFEPSKKIVIADKVTIQK
ncbi:hypothetical protein VVD49_05195 [Uliginosibacterium sp. H3]|uniref:Uncharacterized protein n=1 Tax=Uliginosibacterium silvisoli TaxID=3114758 RepID=A0ABU6K221_9RHOO|nr:hypothetical protein [Uliginosibacterium sp. H3]